MSDTQTIKAGLFDTVVPNGMCIGCGACAAFDPAIDVKLNDKGQYVAVLSDELSSGSIVNRVCPFSGDTADEDELSAELFDSSTLVDPYAGSYLASYAGWVNEGAYRSAGSSGGLVSWLLVELLEQDVVDYVVHVAPQASVDAEQGLFNYVVASTAIDVKKGPKSQYYPVEMSGVISQMLSKPGRYAVVGIPCFVKAIRLAARESAVLDERLTVAVGLVSAILLAILPFAGPSLCSKVPSFCISMLYTPKMVFDRHMYFYAIVTLLLAVSGGLPLLGEK